MAYCSKCGAGISPDSNYCPNCGEKISFIRESNIEYYDRLKNTPSINNEYDSKDSEDNKFLAVLSYFGILFLVPLLGAKNSKFARFHANQGLVLYLFTIILEVALAISGCILLSISYDLIGLYQVLAMVAIVVMLILTITGIVNAAKGQAKELPLIGGIRIIK